MGKLTSAEYILREDAVTVADYAVDQHPYDKIPGKPETFSEYNQGWHDACDYIREKLENLPAADFIPVRRSFWESYDTSAYIGCEEDGNPRYAARKFYVCNNDNCRNKTAVRTKYCPNCGAKMDGGNDNGD